MKLSKLLLSVVPFMIASQTFAETSYQPLDRIQSEREATALCAQWRAAMEFKNDLLSIAESVLSTKQMMQLEGGWRDDIAAEVHEEIMRTFGNFRREHAMKAAPAFQAYVRAMDERKIERLAETDKILERLIDRVASEIAALGYHPRHLCLGVKKTRVIDSGFESQ